MTPRPVQPAPVLRIRSIDEAEPGPKLGAVFDAYWPAYRRWMAKAEPLDADACVVQLASHMPELLPTFERLVALGPAWDRDAVARFLTLYRPPRMVRGCSQAVVTDAEGPALVRNYDHAPHLFDGLVLRSAWGGVPVVAVTDCLWGALDGVNDHGLAVALAFGGRPEAGDGFAAPLIVRYLLQTCRDTGDMRAAMARLPVYMAYTFVGVDRAGGFVTAYAGPGRETVFDDRPSSTNHQGRVEWAAYARQCRSESRLRHIEALLDTPGMTAATLEDDFLRPPLFRTDYAKASGTLYTATYRPDAGLLTLRWPARAAGFGLDAFEEQDLSVSLGPDSAARRASGPRRA